MSRGPFRKGRESSIVPPEEGGVCIDSPGAGRGGEGPSEKVENRPS